MLLTSLETHFRSVVEANFLVSSNRSPHSTVGEPGSGGVWGRDDGMGGEGGGGGGGRGGGGGGGGEDGRDVPEKLLHYQDVRQNGMKYI